MESKLQESVYHSVEDIDGYHLKRYEKSALIIGFSSVCEIAIHKVEAFQQGAPQYLIEAGMLTASASKIAIKDTWRREIVCVHNDVQCASFPILSEVAANRILDIIDQLEAG